MTTASETKVIAAKPFNKERGVLTLIAGIVGIYIEYQQLQKHPRDYFEWSFLILFCVAVLFILSKLMSVEGGEKHNSLTLTSKGFEVRGKVYQWPDIRQFGVEKTHITIFDYFTRDKTVYWIFNKRKGAQDSDAMAEIHSRDYEMDADRLAALLNDWLQRHTGKRIPVHDGPKLLRQEALHVFAEGRNYLVWTLLAVGLIASLIFHLSHHP